MSELTTNQGENIMDCYYDDPDTCSKETWTCLTCGTEYCTEHRHCTDEGENVECVVCERERLEKGERQ